MDIKADLSDSGEPPAAALGTLSEFELHYDLDNRPSAINILNTIVQELSSHRSIHDWDEKLVSEPVKKLAIFAQRELISLGFDTGSYMVNYAAVDEVRTVCGVNYRQSAFSDPSQVGHNFFTGKVRSPSFPGGPMRYHA